jgi:hypothetical protein
MQPVIGGSSLNVTLPEHKLVMVSHRKAGGLVLQFAGNMLSFALATRQDTPGRLDESLRHLPSFGFESQNYVSNSEPCVQ